MNRIKQHATITGFFFKVIRAVATVFLAGKNSYPTFSPQQGITIHPRILTNELGCKLVESTPYLFWVLVRVLGGERMQ
jgi:hypothetical protein